VRETLISSETIFSGRVVTLRLDTVRLADGSIATREVVAHEGAVAIVPFLDPETVLMVRQYRRAVDQVLLEIPAGTREKGEDPDECARRELVEETGYSAGTMTRLFEQFLAPGYSSERLIVYEARDLRPGVQKLDSDERVELESVPTHRMLEMIRKGEIRDAKTIAGLLVSLSQ
jgi:ADP-ribose pyrophosphatase